MTSLRSRVRDALVRVEAGGYANLVAGGLLDAVPAHERPFATALLYGTVERAITLDYAIGVLAERQASDLLPETRALLRLGLYQLMYMPRVPAYAAVRETVGAAKGAGEASLVNAVLRAYVRRGGVSMPSRAKNVARCLSVTHSIPLWIVKRFLSLFGEETTENILASFNRVRPLSLTVNTLRTSEGDLLSRLQSAGYDASPASPLGILLPGAPPHLLPGFDTGDFFVQNASSRAAALVLGAMPGDVVADTCACPGGKSFAAALTMGDRGKIYAFDLHESKLPLIVDGARRLGIHSIETACVDATVGCADLDGRVDRVLCDVPCSGLGVLGEKPDLRYRKETGVSELPDLQYAILSRSAAYVRPGGTLVYSTCTLLPEENGQVVSRFLGEHPDFRPVGFTVSAAASSRGMLTILPDDTSDGFFISKMERVL